MVPYGRGGAGFSVLDVTNPIISPGVGPLHMFSVYNDYINQVVYIADENGNITERQYTSNSVNIEDSREALRANANLDDALTQMAGQIMMPQIFKIELQFVKAMMTSLVVLLLMGPIHVIEEQLIHLIVFNLMYQIIL